MNNSTDWEKRVLSTMTECECDKEGCPLMIVSPNTTLKVFREILSERDAELKCAVVGLRKNRHGSGETEHWWVKYDDVLALLPPKE